MGGGAATGAWRLYDWAGLSLRVHVGPCTYEPAEDSRLAVEALRRLADMLGGMGSLVDIGTGTGILALAGSLLGASRVVATDISPWALRSALATLSGRASILRCNWAECLAPASFDVAVSNPPYLPVGDEEVPGGCQWLSRAWSGAPRAVLEACLEAARVAERAVVMVYSSLSGVDVEDCLARAGFQVAGRLSESFFMETLYSVIALRVGSGGEAEARARGDGG